MSITLIAAISENNCIGKNGILPWHIPEDLAHFKEITLGKVVLMGRKTWESIPEKFRPLKERQNVVITGQKEYPVPEGVLLFPNVGEAIDNFQNQRIFVIGGAQIYGQTFHFADTLELTEVKRVVDGDAFFPKVEKSIWGEVKREEHNFFDFVTYKRI